MYIKYYIKLVFRISSFDLDNTISPQFIWRNNLAILLKSIKKAAELENRFPPPLYTHFTFTTGMAVLISMFKVSQKCYQGIMQEITSLTINWSPGLHLLTRKNIQ